MGISRRLALQSSPAFAVIGSTVLSRQTVMAQDVAAPIATPSGTPVVDDPEALLELLQETPVETPLFPADTGMVRALPWIDEGDTDLIDTGGGVIMETGRDEYGNPIGPGVYLVFPDAGAALSRLDASFTEAQADMKNPEAEVVSEVVAIEVAGYPGITTREPDGAVTLLVVGPVIGGGLGDSRMPGDPGLRSLVNCAVLIDHLRSVMS